MGLGARHSAHISSGDPIGQVPRSELIGVAWTCREPQLELALRLTRQIQNHDAVRGPIIQHDRSPQHAAAVVVRYQRALHPGERLVPVGAQFDLGIGGVGQRRLRQPDFKLDRGF